MEREKGASGGRTGKKDPLARRKKRRKRQIDHFKKIGSSGLYTHPSPIMTKFVLKRQTHGVLFLAKIHLGRYVVSSV